MVFICFLLFVFRNFFKAIAEFEKALTINPEFSQPYNQLGYAQRFLSNYAAAETAFKKYIELIPDDPNPYDSYAELLMKMGKFDESIQSYEKALEVNPNFVASHIGIATNLNYLGKHPQAREQLDKLYSMARNDGERRAAHFTRAVSYVDEGNFAMAIDEVKKQFALAEKINDAANMSGDLALIGTILLEAGKLDEAASHYDKALKIIKESDLAREVKENAIRGNLYNQARVALLKNDLDGAKSKTEQLLQEAKAVNNTFQIWLAHELAGLIALAEKDYDTAITELNQANQQNPYTFYRLALAYQGKGDKSKARELFQKAAGFNALNNLNQVFIRKKAAAMVAKT